MNELNKFCKDQIIERNNNKLWYSFKEICFNNNINEFDNFIMENYGDYERIFKLELKYDNDGVGLLIKLYENKYFDILDHILNLKWNNELIINNLMAKCVDDNDYYRLEKLTNKTLYCLRMADMDVCHYCLRKSKKNNNTQIIEWLNNYFQYLGELKNINN
jgi:hypothetical protein